MRPAIEAHVFTIFDGIDGAGYHIIHFPPFNPDWLSGNTMLVTASLSGAVGVTLQ